MGKEQDAGIEWLEGMAESMEELESHSEAPLPIGEKHEGESRKRRA